MIKSLVLWLLFFSMVFAAGAAVGWGLIPARVIEVDQVRNTNDIKDFQATDELESWLKTQDVRRVPGWICQDYAFWLSRQAFYDGYYLPVWVMDVEAYNFYFGINSVTSGYSLDTLHMLNSAEIDGIRYLVEPQNLKVAERK